MPTIANQLTREEFEVFLMIYAAHVDYIYTDEEKEYIMSISNDDTYDKMFRLFNNTNDYASMKILLENKYSHFNTEEDKEYFFNLLKNVFKVDGDYARIEKSFINFFERLIETT